MQAKTKKTTAAAALAAMLGGSAHATDLGSCPVRTVVAMPTPEPASSAMMGRWRRGG
jgi:hypothetical protein